MIQDFFTIGGIISLLTLVLMEIVLGIDNIVFVSIVCDRLPRNKQKQARAIGLSLALIFRIILLTGITFLIGLKNSLFNLFDIDFSGKDLIFLAGGLFLMYKSTVEIHAKTEGKKEDSFAENKKSSIALHSAIAQIVVLDIVFSFDSILTAVGMVQNNLLIMVIAVVVSMFIILAFSGFVSDFINKHPSIKMLALSFLLMIGTMLVAEALHFHVPKGYVYFGMTFSLFVELLNLRSRKKGK